MLVLSTDPEQARREMNALIFYLTTFSYIDGEFDPQELAFIRGTVQKIVEHRIDAGGHGGDASNRRALIERFQQTFDEVLAEAQRQVIGLLGETIAEAEERRTFVACKLKQRCFELFQGLSPQIRSALIGTVDELLLADGVAHAAELAFREELLALLSTGDDGAQMRAAPIHEARCPVEVRELRPPRHTPATHRFFAQLERPLADDPGQRARQLAADRVLLNSARETLLELGRRGRGALEGRRTVDQLAGLPPGLDQYVYHLHLSPERRYELLVLGDLHGCYSCLKAALIQSRFFDKLAAFHAAPGSAPEPKLVLLGDYIDRGIYGLEVLRLALHLLVNAPDQVYLLRGNHEMLVEHQGEIQSVVRPAETIETLRTLAPRELLVDLMHLFDALPSSLLFGRVLLTHGGVPRDGLIKQHLSSLAGLNHPEVRFQMLWSDPSTAEVIPRALQDATARFGFGRLQARGFLQRLGCHTLIRGHDRVEEGFQRNYQDGQLATFTLFSAGGETNGDLCEDSSYRAVRPMALTLTSAGGLDDPVRIESWPIDWAPYNTPKLNGLYG